MTTVKAGARHSAADLAEMQAMHDLTVRQGATCGGATKALQLPIKATPEGHVSGWLVKFGGPDVVGDHFVKGTDFGVENDRQVGLYWHHGMDKDVGADPIGSGTVTQLDGGLWFEGWLSKRAKYLAYILKMAADGLLGFSSGADPASVVRVPIPGKAHEYAIRAWHIIEASLTPIPAAGPVATAAMIKATADPRAARIRAEIEAIEREERLNELDQSIRARRIRAELDAIEATKRGTSC